MKEQIVCKFIGLGAASYQVLLVLKQRLLQISRHRVPRSDIRRVQLEYPESEVTLKRGKVPPCLH